MQLRDGAGEVDVVQSGDKTAGPHAEIMHPTPGQTFSQRSLASQSQSSHCTLVGRQRSCRRAPPFFPLAARKLFSEFPALGVSELPSGTTVDQLISPAKALIPLPLFVCARSLQ
jgi:hypothetical protein